MIPVYKLTNKYILPKKHFLEIRKFLIEIGFINNNQSSFFIETFIFEYRNTTLTIEFDLYDLSDVNNNKICYENGNRVNIVIFNGGFIYNLHHLKMILLSTFGKQYCRKVFKFTIKNDVLTGKFDLDKLLSE